MAAKKQPASPRKTSRTAVQESLGANARADLSPDELKKLISEAAYFRAKQRGFEPGHELEDWIQAEAEVMRRIERRA